MLTSDIQEKEEVVTKIFRSKNTIFSMSLVYIRLMGLKLVLRFVLNIVLGLAIYFWIRKKTKKDFEKKSKVEFLMKMLINVILILNFEYTQTDTRLAIFSLTSMSTLLEKFLIFTDITIYAGMHLFLFSMFNKQRNPLLMKPYEKYVYETIFVFQKKEESLNFTILDNWREVILPVRLYENLFYAIRLLIIKGWQ
jgi:hypothetical protein